MLGSVWFCLVLRALAAVLPMIDVCLVVLFLRVPPSPVHALLFRLVAHGVAAVVHLTFRLEGITSHHVTSQVAVCLW